MAFVHDFEDTEKQVHYFHAYLHICSPLPLHSALKLPLQEKIALLEESVRKS